MIQQVISAKSYKLKVISDNNPFLSGILISYIGGLHGLLTNLNRNFRIQFINVSENRLE